MRDFFVFFRKTLFINSSDFHAHCLRFVDILPDGTFRNIFLIANSFSIQLRKKHEQQNDKTSSNINRAKLYYT